MLLRSEVQYRKAMYAQCKGKLAVVMVVVADLERSRLVESVPLSEGVQVAAPAPCPSHPA
jgi:hypothetical protein